MRRALDFLFLVIVLSAGCGAPGGPPVKSSPQGECTATFAPTLTPTRTQAPTFTPTHTPTPTPTYTPTHTPTWTPTPTPLTIDAREFRGVKFEIAGQVVEVSPITGEQALQILQWERQNDQEWWRWWLSVIGLIGAMLALIFAGWRARSHAQQIREQMLASYRERLFTDDPAAIVAAAMSLSKYPSEAIWLVTRWAEIHRKNEQILEWNKSRDESLDRILQSIQDALSNLSKTKSWALFWREIDLKSRVGWAQSEA